VRSNHSVNRTLTRYAASRRLPQALGAKGEYQEGETCIDFQFRWFRWRRRWRVYPQA